MTDYRDERIAELETQVRLLVEEGQILMDALSVFADEDNWTAGVTEEYFDYDDDCCGEDYETDFVFANSDGLDPVDFAQRTINSLRN